MVHNAKSVLEKGQVILVLLKVFLSVSFVTDIAD